MFQTLTTAWLGLLLATCTVHCSQERAVVRLRRGSEVEPDSFKNPFNDDIHDHFVNNHREAIPQDGTDFSSILRQASNEELLLLRHQAETLRQEKQAEHDAAIRRQLGGAENRFTRFPATGEGDPRSNLDQSDAAAQTPTVPGPGDLDLKSLSNKLLLDLFLGPQLQQQLDTREPEINIQPIFSPPSTLNVSPGPAPSKTDVPPPGHRATPRPTHTLTFPDPHTTNILDDNPSDPVAILKSLQNTQPVIDDRKPIEVQSLSHSDQGFKERPAFRGFASIPDTSGKQIDPNEESGLRRTESDSFRGFSSIPKMVTEESRSQEKTASKSSIIPETQIVDEESTSPLSVHNAVQFPNFPTNNFDKLDEEEERRKKLGTEIFNLLKRKENAREIHEEESNNNNDGTLDDERRKQELSINRRKQFKLGAGLLTQSKNRKEEVQATRTSNSDQDLRPDVELEKEVRRQVAGIIRRKQLFDPDVRRKKLLDSKRRQLINIRRNPKTKTSDKATMITITENPIVTTSRGFLEQTTSTTTTTTTTTSEPHLPPLVMETGGGEEESVRQEDQEEIIDAAIQAVLARAVSGQVRDNPLVWAAISSIYQFVDMQEQLANTKVPREILISLTHLTKFLSSETSRENAEMNMMIETMDVKPLSRFNDSRRKSLIVQPPRTSTTTTSSTIAVEDDLFAKDDFNYYDYEDEDNLAEEGFHQYESTGDAFKFSFRQHKDPTTTTTRRPSSTTTPTSLYIDTPFRLRLDPVSGLFKTVRDN